jgi:4,5-dihydroxyphthalate decarboxylase
MPPLRLSIALNESDQVRDLVHGTVRAEGIDLTASSLSVEEIFYRFVHFAEWDVSEMSLAKYTNLQSAADESPFVAIPVFTSRVFRHSAIFVRNDDSITEPGQLRGRRIGIPEWTQTATVYARGLLAHDYGVPLEAVEWVQAGTNEPGRVEGVRVSVPPGVTITPVPDKTLNDMLVAGEIDALIAAHPPLEIKQATGKLRRLFSDFERVEAGYYEATGIFPIMHLVAIRRDVYEQNRWVAMELFKAFTEAKRRSLERMVDPNAPFTPVPWAWVHAQRVQEQLGHDFWPYGIEPNRTTLETFLRYAHEQRVCERLLTPDELFVDEVRSVFRI